MTSKSIGVNVRAYMQQTGMTQRELALRSSGVSLAAVSAIVTERMLDRSPTATTLERIAEALCCSVADLYSSVNKTDQDAAHETRLRLAEVSADRIARKEIERIRRLPDHD